MSTRTSTWKAVADFSALIREPPKAQRALAELRQEFGRSSSAIAPLERDMQGLGRTLDRLSNAFKNNAREARDAASATSSAYRSAERQIDNFASGAERALNAVARAQQNASSSTRSMNQAMNAFAANGANIIAELQRIAAALQQNTAAAQANANANNNANRAQNNLGQGARNNASAIFSFGGAIDGLRLRLFAMQAVAGGVATSLLKMGIAFNQSQENAKIAFTTILGDGGKAADLMTRITQTAAVTPFETEGLVDAVRKLLAFGVPLEKILTGSGTAAKGLVISVGDAVAAMGGGADMMEGAMLAIGQMQAKGKVSSEELLQLAERGIPVFDILREKLGLTAAQVANIGNEGISATKGIDALSAGLEERFGGAMAAQSRTFAGLLSTLSDNLKITMGGLTKGLFDTMKSGMQALGDVMQNLTTRARDVGWAKAIEEQWPLLKPIIDGLATGFKAVHDIFVAAAPGAKAFAAALFAIVATGAGVFFQVLGTTLGVAAHVITSIPTPVMELVGAMVALRLVTMGVTAAWGSQALGRALLQGLALYTRAGVALQGLVAAMGRAAATTALANNSWSLTRGALAGAMVGIRSVAGAAAGAGRSFLSMVGGMVGLGPVAGGVILALGGVALGVKAAVDHYNKMDAATNNVSQATGDLTNSLGVQLGVVKQVAREHELYGLASDKARESNEKFAEQNAKTLDTLKGMATEMQRRQFILQIGFDMVQKGADPKEAFASIQRLAQAARVELPIGFNPEDLYNLGSQLISVTDSTKKAADQIKKYLGDSHNWDAFTSGLAGASTDIEVAMKNLPAMKDQIDSIGQSSKNMIDHDAIGAGIQQYATFEQAVKNSNLTIQQQNDLLNYSADQFAKTFGEGFGFSIHNIKDLGGVLSEVASGTTHASSQFQDYAKKVEEAAKANGGDLPKAIDEVNKKYPTLAGNLLTAADAQRTFTNSVGDAIPVYSQNQDYIDNMTKELSKFEDFGKALESAVVPGATAAEVLGKKFQVSGNRVNAGVGQMTKALRDQHDTTVQFGKNMDTILARLGPDAAGPVLDTLRSMGADGAAYAAQLAKGTTKGLQDFADAIANSGPTAAMSYAQFSATLRDQIKKENQFTSDLLTLSAMGFTNLANKFATEGPAAAAALHQSLEQPRADLQALEDDIKHHADVSATNLEAYQRAFAAFSSGGIHSIKDLATAMDTDVPGAMDILKNLRDVVNSWPQGTLRTQILAQIDAIAPQAVTIPAVIKSTQVLDKAGNVIGVNFGNRVQERQEGGIDFYAGGGMRAGLNMPTGPEQHVAQIAPAGAMRVWAEPETGGEAYIPLSPGKRERSLAIWAQTGRILGALEDGGLLAMASGAIAQYVNNTSLGNVSNAPPMKVHLDTSDLLNLQLVMSGGPRLAGNNPGFQREYEIVRSQFPYAVLTSGYRPGDPGYHGQGMAADIGVNGNDQSRLWPIKQWLHDTYPESRELIYDGAGNNRPDLKNGAPHAYDRGTQLEHQTHVHWVEEEGGILRPVQEFAFGGFSAGQGWVAPGEVSRDKWQMLLKAGWQTHRGDRRGRLYPPRGWTRNGSRWFPPKGFTVAEDGSVVPESFYAGPGGPTNQVAAWDQQTMNVGTGAYYQAFNAPREANFDPSGIFSQTQSAYTSARSARAQAMADEHNRLFNVTDARAEWYINQIPEKINAPQFRDALNNQVAQMRGWQADLSNISARAGKDVADELKKMGASGAEQVHLMATASNADLESMVRSMNQLKEASKVSVADFTQNTKAATKQTQEFNANLERLAAMGYSDLAKSLKDLGVEGGADIAASAVAGGAAGAAAANQAVRQQQTATTRHTAEIIDLMAWIGKQSGTPGLRAAGQALGWTDYLLAEVVGQASDMLSKMPSAKKLVSEAALYQKGQFFPASGPNVFAAADGAMLRPVDGVRWNEPAAGGESWIPHAPSKRQRARQIWAATGAILGTMLPGSGALTPVAGGMGATPNVANGARVINFNYDIDIINPKQEPASDSVAAAVTRTAKLGALATVGKEAS